MAKRGRDRQAIPTSDAAPSAARTNDSILNLSARVGLGSDSIASDSFYQYSLISRNRQNLDNAYRGSWLVGVAVDSVADDMTRAGVEMMGDIDPGDIEKIQADFSEKAVWQRLADTVRWARLYGGAIAVILIDGQNPSTPLRAETVRKDQFKGLLVLDRWMISPSLDDLITEFGPDMGQPRFYRVNSTQGGVAPTSNSGGPVTGGNASGSSQYSAVMIHYSRVVRFDGAALPFFARQSEQGWGQSVVERLYDRLLAYDSATQGAAQLVYKAHLRVLQVDGLREAIAFGGKALDGLVAQIDFIRKFQTSDGLTLLDAKDVFNVHQYGFSGLPELLAQFSEQLSGALQIPLVRLFGQSPRGFSTGNTDLQNYYDMIGAQQESRMRQPVHMLLDIVCRSTLGKELPPGFGFKFTSLWQMTAPEKANVAGTVTTAVVAAQGAGIISQKVAMEELRQTSHTTGVFTNITDEDIEAADADPPETGESIAAGQDAIPGGGGADSAETMAPEPPAPELPSIVKATTPTADGWVETDHPRDEIGEFTEAGGAGLSSEHHDVANEYKEFAGINEHLRGDRTGASGSIGEAAKFKPRMDAAIAASQTTRTVVLYRGYGAADARGLLSNKGTIRDPAYLSLTRKVAVAREFQGDGYLAAVVVPKGTNAYEFDKSDPQAEVVLARGTKLYLQGISHRDRILTFGLSPRLPLHDDRVQRRTADRFEEQQHPRDGGKFSRERGAGAAAKPAPPPDPDPDPDDNEPDETPEDVTMMLGFNPALETDDQEPEADSKGKD